MPNPKAREVARRAREFCTRLSDWMAAQQLSDPYWIPPNSDVDAYKDVADRRAKRPFGEPDAHRSEATASYRCDFAPEAEEIYDAFAAIGLTPKVSVNMCRAGTNLNVVTMVRDDFQRLSVEAEAMA